MAVKPENMKSYVYRENAPELCELCNQAINLFAFPACDCDPSDQIRRPQHGALSCTAKQPYISTNAAPYGGATSAANQVAH